MGEQKKGTGALYSALLLLISLSILGSAMKVEGYSNVIDYINDFPLTLIFFILPIIGFCVSAIRKNSWKIVKNWLITKSLKYIFMFLSIIVTTYVTYYIIILGNPKTLFEWLTVLIIYISVFIVFLFLKWGEKLAKIPIPKTRIVFKTKQIMIFFGIILLISVLLSTLYYVVTNLDFGFTFLIGYLQSIFIYGAFRSAMEVKLIKKLKVVISIISNIVIVMLFFPLAEKIQETYWIFILVGSVLIIFSYLYGNYTNENIRLKKFILKFED